MEAPGCKSRPGTVSGDVDGKGGWSQESLDDHHHQPSSVRDLPAYTGPELDPEKNSSLPPPLPSSANPRFYEVNFVTFDPPAFEPPPYYPGSKHYRSASSKSGLSTSLSLKSSKSTLPGPLRRRRKQPPPVFYAKKTHDRIQSVSYITFEQHHQQQDSSSSSRKIMASNINPAVMPKVPTTLPPLPSGPRPVAAGAGGRGFSPSKEDMIADLRRQLDDSASASGSSVDSRGGRRRRRNNNNKALAAAAQQKAVGSGLTNPAVLPRLAETKPVRLQLGLNLDVELELKARLQGDVSLTLLVEKKTKPTARPATSAELRPDAQGVVVAEEIFYMRIGCLQLRQTWMEREVSPSLTAAVVAGVAAGGIWFVIEVICSVPGRKGGLALERILRNPYDDTG
ncbi:hypothetical protein B0T19DRAFT_396007 [Cercophora scortea]|uniref:Uncharacterized protein n=1 Tax=Cercophora scortea TaxID=314031 RepID=A0AAE0J3K8_9PEZI|nr:hypothetical protein B0T19DRAFT_396007 [Cercophora scortea]